MVYEGVRREKERGGGRGCEKGVKKRGQGGESLMSRSVSQSIDRSSLCVLMGFIKSTTYLFRLPKTLMIRSLSCTVISDQLAILDKV